MCHEACAQWIANECDSRGSRGISRPNETFRWSMTPSRDGRPPEAAVVSRCNVILSCAGSRPHKARARPWFPRAWRRRPDKRCANYNVARRVPHGERLTLFDSIGDATTPDWIERRSWLKKDDFNVNRFVLIFNFFSIFVQVFLEIRKSF